MLARREKRQARCEKLGVLEFADRWATEPHRRAGIEKNHQVRVGVAEKSLDIGLVGAGVHVPVDESRIVTFRIRAVHGKFLAEAKRR